VAANPTAPAAATTPSVAANPAATTTPVDAYAAALKAKPGDVWSAAQKQAGGRWELPTGATGIGRNWVKYVAPAPVAPTPPPTTALTPAQVKANNDARNALATAVAAQTGGNGGGGYVQGGNYTVADSGGSVDYVAHVVNAGKPAVVDAAGNVITPAVPPVVRRTLQGGSSHGAAKVAASTLDEPLPAAYSRA